MKKALPAYLLAVAVMATASVAARADTFDFTFDGPSVSAMGTFTGNQTSPGSGVFQLSSITGSVQDTSKNTAGTYIINSLSPYFLADNKVYFPQIPVVDENGVSFFSTSGADLNISIDARSGSYILGVFTGTSFQQLPVDSFVVIPEEAPPAPAGAPAPLAGAGLLSFFGAGGLALRKRVKGMIGALLSRRLSEA